MNKFKSRIVTIFSKGFISQGISTLTNLLTTILALRFLRDNEIVAWILLNTVYSYLQSFLRTTFLEPALIQNHSIYRSVIRSMFFTLTIPFLFLLFIFINSFTLNFNSALILCATFFGNVQDVLRHVFLKSDPIKSVISDILWLTALIVAITPVIWFTNTSTMLLIIFMMSPLISSIYLIAIISKFSFKSSKSDFGGNGHLGAMSFFGFVYANTLVLIVSETLGPQWLVVYRALQFLGAPLMVISNLFWISQITTSSERFNQNYFKSVKISTIVLLPVGIFLFLAIPLIQKLLNIGEIPRFSAFIVLITLVLSGICSIFGFLIRKNSNGMILMYGNLFFQMTSVLTLVILRHSLNLELILLITSIFSIFANIFQIYFFQKFSRRKFVEIDSSI